MDASHGSRTQAAVHPTRRGEGRTVRLFGQLEWKLMPAETEGHYCLLETLVPPGMGVPPHQHADQEALYLLEGSLEVARLGPGGLEFFPATAGDFINIPSNEVHGFRNPGGAPARILVMATAGLGAFFLEAGVPSFAGRGRPNRPSLASRDRTHSRGRAQAWSSLPGAARVAAVSRVTHGKVRAHHSVKLRVTS